eukprot:234361-Rhodomonas_salina.1
MKGYLLAKFGEGRGQIAWMCGPAGDSGDGEKKGSDEEKRGCGWAEESGGSLLGVVPVDPTPV